MPHLSAAFRASPLVALALSLLTPGGPSRAQSPASLASTGARTIQPGSVMEARASATSAQAMRVVAPPVLDGRADDAAWASAQVIDNFLEYDPNEGKESRFRTEVRVVYDDRNMYVLARMYDPAPDSIVSLLSRRDVRTASEQLKLVIDSYHDRKTAFQFAVNPAGVKRDYYVSQDNNEDGSWDAVWDVATRIDSVGWVAEFKIPFSQIRYAPGSDHTFGFMVVRDIARTGQRDSWPLLKQKVQGYVSQAGELGGIGELPSPRRLEVVPYTVVKNDTRDFGVSHAGRLERYDHPSKFTAGADLKYGLSSNLTLDAAINPDFGQVEADPAQLNLTAFESFFDERRPFFLEGAGIFTFNTACGDIDSGCTGLFYSRRIGRSPLRQLVDQYGDATSASSTPIAVATKLTGRLANGFSIGLLDAVTQRMDGVVPVGGRIAAIEPATNYAVVRLQRDDPDGQGEMGVMITGVNRRLDESTRPYLNRSALATGLDMRRRFWNKNYELRSYLAMSNVQGSETSIADLQANGVHFFQRPDDDVAYDPTRTSLRGDAERISVSKFGGGHTRFQSVYQRFSPGFETNDLGYLQRADEQLFRNWFALQFNEKTALYQKAFFNFNASERWTTGGMVLGNGLNHNMHIQMKNLWWLHLGGNLNEVITTAYSDRDAFGGPALRRSPSTSGWTGIETDSRNRLTGGLWFNGWKGDEGHSWSANASPWTELRVSSRFSASLSLNWDRNADDKQFYDRQGDRGNDTTHYVFARLDQTTLGLAARMNWTATPNLSFQFYGEPFQSNGSYTHFKELDDPRNARYEARFKPFTNVGAGEHGFNYRQFRSNAVLRYEYRPGSTLFVVWQQNRSNNLDPTDEGYQNGYRISRDYRTVFEDHPNNTFLVKWSYWINP